MNALRPFLSLSLILAVAAVSAAAVPAAAPAAPRPAIAAAPAPASPAAAELAAFLSEVGARVGQPVTAAAPPAGFEPPSFGCGLSCIQQCQFIGCQPTCVNNLNCFCHCGP